MLSLQTLQTIDYSLIASVFDEHFLIVASALGWSFALDHLTHLNIYFSYGLLTLSHITNLKILTKKLAILQILLCLPMPLILFCQDFLSFFLSFCLSFDFLVTYLFLKPSIIFGFIHSFPISFWNDFQIEVHTFRIKFIQLLQISKQYNRPFNKQSRSFLAQQNIFYHQLAPQKLSLLKPPPFPPLIHPFQPFTKQVIIMSIRTPSAQCTQVWMAPLGRFNIQSLAIVITIRRYYGFLFYEITLSDSTRQANEPILIDLSSLHSFIRLFSLYWTEIFATIIFQIQCRTIIDSNRPSMILFKFLSMKMVEVCLQMLLFQLFML